MALKAAMAGGVAVTMAVLVAALIATLLYWGFLRLARYANIKCKCEPLASGDASVNSLPVPYPRNVALLLPGSGALILQHDVNDLAIAISGARNEVQPKNKDRGWMRTSDLSSTVRAITAAFTRLKTVNSTLKRQLTDYESKDTENQALIRYQDGEIWRMERGLRYQHMHLARLSEYTSLGLAVQFAWGLRAFENISDLLQEVTTDNVATWITQGQVQAPVTAEEIWITVKDLIGFFQGHILSCKKADKETFDRHLESVQRSAKGWKDKATAYEWQLHSVKENERKKQERIDTLEKQLAERVEEAAHEIDALKAQLAKTKEEASQKDNDIDALKKQLSEAAEKAQEKDSNADTISKLLADSTKEVANRDSNIANLDKKLAHCTAEVTIQKAKNAKLETENATLKQALQMKEAREESRPPYVEVGIQTCEGIGGSLEHPAKKTTELMESSRQGNVPDSTDNNESASIGVAASEVPQEQGQELQQVHENVDASMPAANENPDSLEIQENQRPASFDEQVKDIRMPCTGQFVQAINRDLHERVWHYFEGLQRLRHSAASNEPAIKQETAIQGAQHVVHPQEASDAVIEPPVQPSSTTPIDVAPATETSKIDEDDAEAIIKSSGPTDHEGANGDLPSLTAQHDDSAGSVDPPSIPEERGDNVASVMAEDRGTQEGIDNSASDNNQLATANAPEEHKDPAEDTEGTFECMYCGKFKPKKNKDEHVKACKEEDSSQSQCSCGKYKIPRGASDDDVARHVLNCRAMQQAKERGSERCVRCRRCNRDYFRCLWYKNRHKKRCGKGPEPAEGPDLSTETPPEPVSAINPEVTEEPHEATASEPQVQQSPASQPEQDDSHPALSPETPQPDSSQTNSPMVPSSKKKKTRRGRKKKRSELR
jgi:phage terminase Nu1 subunit (DNA packaging protein)